MFDLDADAYFIGLRRNNCEVIKDIIKRHTPLEVTIDRFLIDIDWLDGKLREKSVQSFNAMREQLDRLFCDERIQEIQLNLERKVVERFLENYIKGLREYKLYSKGKD